MSNEAKEKAQHIIKNTFNPYKREGLKQKMAREWYLWPESPIIENVMKSIDDVAKQVAGHPGYSGALSSFLVITYGRTGGRQMSKELLNEVYQYLLPYAQASKNTDLYLLSSMIETMHFMYGIEGLLEILRVITGKLDNRDSWRAAAAAECIRAAYSLVAFSRVLLVGEDMSNREISGWFKSPVRYLNEIRRKLHYNTDIDLDNIKMEIND